MNERKEKMNILVLNGSPKRANSDTMHMTRAFLEGIGEQAEIIDVITKNIKPCIGCFSCWTRTPGVCCQKDDMLEILEKMRAADVIIFSTPLYWYSFPSHIKALIDRILPEGKADLVDGGDGSTNHPSRGRIHARYVLICGSGFPNIEKNFEGIAFEFNRGFGCNTTKLFCPESPMFSVAEAAPLWEPRLELLRRAGEQFKQGEVSSELIEQIATPMMPPEVYRSMGGPK